MDYKIVSMNILFNYVKAHWLSIPSFVAFVLFSMDMSGIFGNWGYKLYYPIIILFSFFIYQKKDNIDIRYLFFLIACLVSIIFNDIPSFFRSQYRFIGFIFLFVAFSGMYNNRKIALIRLHTLYIFSLLAVLLVVINYVLLKMGYVNSKQMELYEELGYYSGSTGNNEMGSLGAISIVVLSTYFMKFYKKITPFCKILFLVFFIASISMLAMASSRMALLCALISILLAVYKNNKRNFLKLMISFFIVFLLVIVCASFFGDMFSYMLSKQGGDIANVDTSSRDELWNFRLREFKESPLWGVGFACARYWLNGYGINFESGVVEFASGWLAVLSQLGVLGFVSLMLIVVPNVLYILRNRLNSYCSLWLSSLTVVFVFQPFTEAYITNVGAVLCCLFWLCYSVIDSFRKGYIVESDLFKLLKLK